MSASGGAEVDEEGRSALHRAALNGQREEVERLVTSGAEIEATDEEGQTPLHLAVRKGHCEVVDRLLAAKAAVDAQDQDRATPLHWAAGRGHPATVDRLLASGAAVEAKDSRGRTPLHYASMNGHSEAAQRLVDVGADVDARDDRGRTPWEYAQGSGHETRMAPVLRPVQLGLLSGRTVRCDPEPSRTVRDLLEEAQSKLGTGIKQLVTSSGTVLKEQLSLQEAGIDYTSFVTAIAPVTDGEEVSASQSAPQETDKDDEYKEVEFAVGITMVATTAVWRQYEPKVDVLQVESSLPDTMVPMAPVLKLTPEGVTFPAPIILRIPTCTGANKVFRSNDDGAWEEIREVKFAEDSCEVQLSHFCQVAITGDARPLKALGFIKATSSSSTVKLALLHVGCNRCNDELAWYLQDAQLLQGYQQCSEIEVIGQNDAVILSHSGTRLQELQLRSRSLPAISSEFARQSDAAFQVDINDGQHDFKVTYTAPPAPTNAGGYAASQSTASGSASAQVASSSNPSPQSIQQHVMLSGRFNGDDIKDYMRIVRRRLEELQVTTFMVEAGGGGEFGSLTLMGLGRAKAMVAFCTEEYGALTGVGYETFRELEFAHQQNLPLIPVRNHRVYPPQPSDSEMGRYQNRFILKPTLVYIADEEMQKPREVADQIAQALTTMGLHTPPGAPRAPRAPGAPARKAPPALPPAVSQAAPPAVPLVPHRPPGAPTRPSGRRPRPPVQPSLESMD